MTTCTTKGASSISSLQKLSRRLVVGTHAVNQGLANFSTDLRVLFHGAKNGVVLRQKFLDGFQMLVRADEAVGYNIYYQGVYETEETDFFRSLIDKSSICFDVGANVGYFSLLFAALSREGRVHSFEPVPLNYHVLCTNRLLNGFSNLTANPCAVGDTDGSVDFVISEDSAFSSLVDTGRKRITERVVVEMTTLDDYCEDQNVARVDLLKVDVEGAEERVLIGAAHLLQDHTRRPRTVMLELYEPMLVRHSSTIERVQHRMECLGYKPFVLSNGRLVPFTRKHHNQFENVVFLVD